MASQDSSQPASQPPANPPAGEPGRIKSLDDRFGAIETEQREQRGILGRIEQALTGGGARPKDSGSGGGDGSTGPETGGSGLSIAERVRRGVEEIQAKQRQDAEAQAAADAEKSWRQSVEDRLPERRPAEPMTGVKARLQRALFGKQDER